MNKNVKHWLGTSGLALCAFAMAGCGNTNTAPATPDRSTEVKEIQTEVADEVKDAKNEVVDFFTLDQNSAEHHFREYMESVDERLEAFADRVDDLQDEAGNNMRNSYESLRAQRNSLNDEWERVKAGGAQAWDNTKAGMKDAMDKLNEGLDNLGNTMSNTLSTTPDNDTVNDSQ